MATIQMQTNVISAPGGITLPPPSGVNYSVTNGIASVNPEDVDIAIKALNWRVLDGQSWPANRATRMITPKQGNWPVSGAVTFPDGTTATITAGMAVIPQAWITWAVGYGWQFA